MRTVAGLWLMLGMLQAQTPSIAPGGVVSSGDYSSAALLGVAPGSLISIFGENFTLTPTVTLSSDQTSFNLSVLYASASQLNVRVAPDSPPGRYSLKVETSNGQSTPADLLIVASRFTAFTRNGRPFGPVIAQQQDTAGNVSLNRLLSAASGEDAIVLWGSGLGGIAKEDVEVWVAGVRTAPFYAGPAPGLPGVDQINFFLPPRNPSCFVPFLVRTNLVGAKGGQDSATYTLSVGSGPCKSDFIGSHAALERLDTGRSIRVANLGVTEFQDGAQFTEAWLGEYDAALLSRLILYDADSGAAPISCERREYSYRPANSPPPASLPRDLYGSQRFPWDIQVTATGPGGCQLPLSVESDYVARSVANLPCRAEKFNLAGGDGLSLLSGEILFKGPSQPFPTIAITSRPGFLLISWDNQEAFVPLDLTISSSFTFAGSIFGGLTERRDLVCRLSGPQGESALGAADSAWAQGLPVQTKAAAQRFYSRQGIAANGYADYVLVRTLKVVPQPYPF